MNVISQLIKATIAEEVIQAGMFSVQIDTTQDISSKNQCSIILRYETYVIHGRLIAMVECESSTALHFAELLKKVLQDLNIDLCGQLHRWSSYYAGTVSGVFYIPL